MNMNSMQNHVVGIKSAMEESLFDATHATKKLRTTMESAPKDKAQLMMEKMGYREGFGLGKAGQGRLEPIEASIQKGRRGFGHENHRLKEATLRWESTDKETILVDERVIWVENTIGPISSSQLNTWMILGTRNDSINNETLYCDPDIVAQVIDAKKVFDNLDRKEMHRARARSNPFELIRNAFFQNRAAVKMANIDKATNFLFTNPRNLARGEVLYFADVCAGPGGFSEYILYRKRHGAKGFGFTLRESNDFKLEDFLAGPPEFFHPYYGPMEDGDIYKPENQEGFTQIVMQSTSGRGVHFMMADGGFSVEGQETMQEILSKQLYLCQCLLALKIVREGGYFVTKLFDVFTPFSAGLIYLMYRSFAKITIFKPNSSRPANSERYLVCRGKLANVQDTADYLTRANLVLLENDKSKDVLELVPYDVISDDTVFMDFIKESNEMIAKGQIVALLKIAAFAENEELSELRQAEIKKQCMESWFLPSQPRLIIPQNVRPEEKFWALVQNVDGNFLAQLGLKLDKVCAGETLARTPYDWSCVPSSSGPNVDDDRAATFFVGLGRNKVFQHNRGNWIRLLNVELPRDTVIFGELVNEYRGQRKQQRKTNALHIIDAHTIAGFDCSTRSIEHRHKEVQTLCESLWKPLNSDYIRIRPKYRIALRDNLDEKLQMSEITMKNGRQAMAYWPPMMEYEMDGDEPYYIIPNSILFLKGTAANWNRFVSRSNGLPYYFEYPTRRNYYDNDKSRPECSNACFIHTVGARCWYPLPENPDFTFKDVKAIIRHAIENPM